MSGETYAEPRCRRDRRIASSSSRSDSDSDSGSGSDSGSEAESGLLGREVPVGGAGGGGGGTSSSCSSVALSFGLPGGAGGPGGASGSFMFEGRGRRFGGSSGVGGRGWSGGLWPAIFFETGFFRGGGGGSWVCFGMEDVGGGMFQKGTGVIRRSLWSLVVWLGVVEGKWCCCFVR